MPHVIADRVKETTTTTGTGTISLAGAASGFRTFVDGVGDGNTTYYAIVDGTAWEVGIGTVTDATPDTLSRTTVLSSSTGSAISLSGGSAEVFCTIPARAGDGIIASGAPNQDFDLTNGGAGGAVTIISKSIAGIAAGDQVELEAWVTLLNNSGATRAYNPVFSLGGMSAGGAEFSNTLASASNRATRKWMAVFGVTSASSAGLVAQELGITSCAAGVTSGNQLGAGYSMGYWNTSSSDLTGIQTVSVTVASSSTTGTQTLTLVSYVLRKVAAV